MEYSQSFKDRQLTDFLVKDRFRTLRHVSFLLGLLILFYNSNFPHEYAGIFKYYALLFVYIIFILMFYFNMYVLVPRCLFKGYYIRYLVFLIFMVSIGLNLIGYYTEIYLVSHRIIPRIVGNGIVNKVYDGFIISVPVILVTTTVKIFQRWTKDNDRINELKSLTMNMELNQLKNQINPHFLFNMLNNVNMLIKSDPDKAYKVILKLSEFLRYQLYENNEAQTLLVSEINFLSNFLNLEKTRRDNFDFEIENLSAENNLKNTFIPPNLFTTFVENAVKYSVDISGENSFVKIQIELKNHKLHFSCINSKGEDELAFDSKNGGLGLINIQRRLELLYANRYKLDIKNTKNQYTVNLTIPL